MKRGLILWLMGLACAVPALTQEVRLVQVETLPQTLAGEWLFRTGHDPAWSSPFRERRGWQVIKVPGPWERQGHAGYDGHAWYRLQLLIDNSLAGHDIGLDLGLVADVDEVFLNGRTIGSTGSFPPRLDRSVLSRRYYRLPRDLIRWGDRNELAIHVYNENHLGGLLGPGPQLCQLPVLQSRQIWREAAFVSLAAVLLAMALLQVRIFFLDRTRMECLIFAAFLVTSAGYSLTHTNWVLAPWLGHSGTYRLHVAFLLASAALAPPVFYRIARRPLPVLLQVLQGVLAMGTVFAMVWRSDAELFIWLVLAHIAVLILAVVFLRLIGFLLRQRRPWAWELLATTGLLVVTVVLDVLGDFGALARATPWLLETLGPFGLLPVSAVVCLAILEFWVRDRCGEASEAASGILPWERFMITMGRELDRSRRSGNPLTVSILRISRGGIALAPDILRGEAMVTLRRSLRHMDTLAHLGEDTLCLLLPETDERTAMATLERLRRTMAASPPAQGSRLATSAGVAEFRPHRHITAAELVREAEAALYAALNEGGDCTATAP